MGNLLLSADNIVELNEVLSNAEKINGCKMYKATYNYSLDCKHWDCAISCYCANSRD